MEEEVNWGGQEKDARPVTTGNAKDPHISWTWHGPMSLCKGPTHVTPSCSPVGFPLIFVALLACAAMVQQLVQERLHSYLQRKANSMEEPRQGGLARSQEGPRGARSSQEELGEVQEKLGGTRKKPSSSQPSHPK